MTTGHMVAHPRVLTVGLRPDPQRDAWLPAPPAAAPPCSAHRLHQSRAGGGGGRTPVYLTPRVGSEGWIAAASPRGTVEHTSDGVSGAHGEGPPSTRQL